MKNIFLTLVIVVLSFSYVLAQQINDSTYANRNWSYGKCYKMPNNKPENWVPSKQVSGIRNFSKKHNSFVDKDLAEQSKSSCTQDCGNLKAGIDLNIGRSFEGNHQRFTPIDNTLAISNDGLIVSVDNGSVGYFKETGDTIAKFNLNWNHFYSDSTITPDLAFDPRIIYDRYENRFILVTLYKEVSDSRIIVSFSDSLIGDTVTWNHYYIHCDSVFNDIDEEGFWFDYLNIAINKNELFIESKVEDDLFGSESTVIFQIKKQDGYSNLPTIQKKVWKNILNADGNHAKNVVPLSDAFQLDSYSDKIYFVSNNSENSVRMFWYVLDGDINDTTAQIQSHNIQSPLYYSVASYASQMGGDPEDRISIYDNEILSGYHQNGKLHFTYHRSDNGWMEVVYNIIDLTGGAPTITAHTWGGDGTNNNYLFPTIACFGIDSTDESAIIAFQRTGPNKYIELCAVNYDNGWSSQSTVIKEGVGLLNQSSYNGTFGSYERFGDYIDIQRRYNQKACWVAGQFTFDSTGTSPNHFGQTNGVNTWIAEIGDIDVSINELNNQPSFVVYPNPLTGNQLTINPYQNNISEIVVTDILGKLILTHQNNKNGEVKLTLPTGLSGLYLISIKSKTPHYEIYKIIINN